MRIIVIALIFVFSTCQAESIRFVEPLNRMVPNGYEFKQSKTQELDLVLDLGLIFVNLYTHDNKKLFFLLDTGSDLTIISQNLVKKLNLNQVAEAEKTISSVQSKSKIKSVIYSIPEIKFSKNSNLILKQVPVIAIDENSPDFHVMETLEIDGIIGINAFYELVLTLDLSKSKLIISDEPVFLSANKLELNDKFFVPVIYGQERFGQFRDDYKFLVDTGYNGFVKMPKCYPREKISNEQTSVITFDVFNNREMALFTKLIGDLEIGPITLARPEVLARLGGCEKQIRWGLLGTKFLEDYIVSIDLKTRHFIVNEKVLKITFKK